MNKAAKVCDLITKITDKDFDELTALANGCVSYSHPLKLQRTALINAEGEADLKIIEKLKELKQLIIDKPTREDS